MLAQVDKIIHRIMYRSIADNIEFVRAKLSRDPARNDMLEAVLASEHIGSMVGRALRNRGVTTTALLGDAEDLQSWLPGLRGEGVDATVREWDWNCIDEPGVIARIPYANEHWELVDRATSAHGARVMVLSELLGSFALMYFLASKLDYFKTMEEALPIYLGKEFFGPLQQLNGLFNLTGKRVIEFGPFDGYQTCGLSYLGANVTSIEARAENVLKTRAALEATGLSAHITIDDFHNAHTARYGRFDLAFAHGVYYHSIAPLVFLGLLTRLADRVFIGGFCATDALPKGAWETLRHNGELYRVKRYFETTGFTAGVNRTAYFFHSEDLMRFFRISGFEIAVVSDANQNKTAGQFIRFLATRAS
ncbi:MAG: hypothetical protein IH606_18290 [Burkholderiales bacterium]|nr:hypothetical protein [Burkholderiales bacterium]